MDLVLESSFCSNNNNNDNAVFSPTQDMTQCMEDAPPPEAMSMTQEYSQQSASSPTTCMKKPWGHLMQPFVPHAAPLELWPTTTSTSTSTMLHEHWLGRSKQCAVVVLPPSHVWNDPKNHKWKPYLQWAHSMISNRHCRIYMEATSNTSTNHRGGSEAAAAAAPPPTVYIEDASVNGTWINGSGTGLRNGQRRPLYSGDEICLVNPHTLQKKCKHNHRLYQNLVKYFTFCFFRHHHPPPMMMMASSPTTTTTVTAVRRKLHTEYDVREVLGDGTSGQVRRAIHRATGKPVAIKMIPMNHAHAQNNQDLEREAEILASLNHPYIVKLWDWFSQANTLYLVLEWMPGGDLFDAVVQRECYTQEDARKTMRRLLAAVHYLHDDPRQIVHRDIKLENILLQSKSCPYDIQLTDFGLAKSCRNNDLALKTFCGTPQYFAPEVLQRQHTVAGQGRYGKPADLWSCGIVLFILLHGRPPFEDDNGTGRMGLSAEYQNTPVSDLLHHLLEPNPQRRWTVQQACDHEWFQMADGDTHLHPLEDPLLLKKEPHESSPMKKKLEQSVVEQEQKAVPKMEKAHPDQRLKGDSARAMEPKPSNADELSQKRDAQQDIVGNGIPTAKDADKQEEVSPIQDQQGVPQEGSPPTRSKTGNQENESPISPNVQVVKFREIVLAKRQTVTPTKSHAKKKQKVVAESLELDEDAIQSQFSDDDDDEEAADSSSCGSSAAKIANAAPKDNVQKDPLLKGLQQRKLFDSTATRASLPTKKTKVAPSTPDPRQTKISAWFKKA